jgi:uncharacterized membrane protein
MLTAGRLVALHASGEQRGAHPLGAADSRQLVAHVVENSTGNPVAGTGTFGLGEQPLFVCDFLPLYWLAQVALWQNS